MNYIQIDDEEKIIDLLSSINFNNMDNIKSDSRRSYGNDDDDDSQWKGRWFPSDSKMSMGVHENCDDGKVINIISSIIIKFNSTKTSSIRRQIYKLIGTIHQKIIRVLKEQLSQMIQKKKFIVNIYQSYIMMHIYA